MLERFELAQQVAQDASEIAQALFRSRDDLQIQTKQPRDFVSEADKTVEKFICKQIAKDCPDDTFMGEEFGGNISQAFWCIDPIDGTANFLKGSPLWGISISYLVNQEVQLGVIALPELNLLLAANKANGLSLNGKPFKRQTTDVPIIAVGENSYWEAKKIAILELLLRESGWGVAEYRCATVGLVFAALGYTDGYLEKYTSLWDIAAGSLICKEAGLEVQVGGKTELGQMWIQAASVNVLNQLSDIWADL